jgi:rare lipoprotein A
MAKPRCLALWLVFMLTIATGVQAQTRSGRAAYHYHTSEMITASRYEPVGSVLDVTHPGTGKTVRVRVAGSGPYNGNRILDLSTGAFSALYGGTGRGVGPVRYTVVSRGGGGLDRREYRNRRGRSHGRTRHRRTHRWKHSRHR